MPQDMLEKEDLSRIMIISVSVIGVVLLVLNIGLVAGCMLKRRAKRIRGLFFFFGKEKKILVNLILYEVYMKQNTRIKSRF